MDNEEPNRIEFFKAMHYSTQKGWTTPTAEETYVRLNHSLFITKIL